MGIRNDSGRGWIMVKLWKEEVENMFVILEAKLNGERKIKATYKGSKQILFLSRHKKLTSPIGDPILVSVRYLAKTNIGLYQPAQHFIGKALCVCQKRPP